MSIALFFFCLFFLFFHVSLLFLLPTPLTPPSHYTLIFLRLPAVHEDIFSSSLYILHRTTPLSPSLSPPPPRHYTSISLRLPAVHGGTFSFQGTLRKRRFPCSGDGHAPFSLRNYLRSSSFFPSCSLDSRQHYHVAHR